MCVLLRARVPRVGGGRSKNVVLRITFVNGKLEFLGVVFSVGFFLSCQTPTQLTSIKIEWEGGITLPLAFST